jgi:thioredoxin-dependent peroxiredoxin
MAQITLKGNPIQTSGKLPSPGYAAPDFSLTQKDLSDMSLRDVTGKRVVLNIFASLDTSVCATSVRRFNEEIVRHDNAVVLCISRDLPFAQTRFCEAEGIQNAILLSEMRHRDFGDKYGVAMLDGPMAGLLARAVIVLDESGKVIYSELVNEFSEEPDYAKALDALKNAAGVDACTSSLTAEHARVDDEDDVCDDGRAG